MKIKFHSTFLCGGVVLVVLNLCTKNRNQLLRQVKLAGNIGTDMSFQSLTLFMRAILMKFFIKPLLSGL